MRTMLLFLSLSFILAITSCDKLFEDPPEVETFDAFDIEAFDAKLAGKVIGEEDLEISERGIVWSRLPDPNINNTVSAAGSGVGSFDVHLKYLDPATIYYYRAYAKYKEDVIYGEEKSFTTKP